MSNLPRLSRSLLGLPTPPVRLLHLGLGNFHRAHQAWYTANTPDGSAWGIAAFTGRRPDTADALAPQNGLYTLITRGAEGDAFDVLGRLPPFTLPPSTGPTSATFADPIWRSRRNRGAGRQFAGQACRRSAGPSGRRRWTDHGSDDVAG